MASIRTIFAFLLAILVVSVSAAPLKSTHADVKVDMKKTDRWTVAQIKAYIEKQQHGHNWIRRGRRHDPVHQHHETYVTYGT